MKFLAQRFVAERDGFHAWLDSGSKELADCAFERRPVDIVAAHRSGYAFGRGTVDMIDTDRVRVRGTMWRPTRRWETTFLRMWLRALERMGRRTALTPAAEEKG